MGASRLAAEVAPKGRNMTAQGGALGNKSQEQPEP